MGLLQPLAGARDLGPPVIGLNLLHASLAAVIARKRLVHGGARGVELGFGSGESGLVIPIFHVGQHVTLLYRLTFLHVNLLHRSFDLRLQLRDMGGADGGWRHPLASGSE